MDAKIYLKPEMLERGDVRWVIDDRIYKKSSIGSGSSEDLSMLKSDSCATGGKEYLQDEEEAHLLGFPLYLYL